MLRSARFPLALMLALLIVAGDAAAEKLGLGRPASAEEVAGWDIDVRPDGQGLPSGKGTVEAGELIYQEKCASCHGEFAEGAGRWPVLAGGTDTLASDNPVKTIGSYWPYLSTAFDYIKRSMPFGDAQSLSDDEVYAITAYLLYMNDLVEEDFVLTRDNFTGIRLPNEANFFDDPRATVRPSRKPAELCMKDCKAEVKILRRALTEVTPD